MVTAARKKPAKRKRPPRKGGKPGQKPHVRSQEIADRIQGLAAFGLPQDQIAKLEKMAPVTLRKYYQDEFDQGYIKANANIGKSAYDQAVGRPAEYDARGNLLRAEILPDKSVAIFLSKVRLGMRERVEHTGPDGGGIPLEVDLKALSTDEIRQFLALLNKAEGKA